MKITINEKLLDSEQEHELFFDEQNGYPFGVNVTLVHNTRFPNSPFGGNGRIDKFYNITEVHYRYNRYYPEKLIDWLADPQFEGSYSAPERKPKEGEKWYKGIDSCTGWKTAFESDIQRTGGTRCNGYFEEIIVTPATKIHTSYGEE